MAAEIKRPRDRTTTEQVEWLEVLSGLLGVPTFVVESVAELDGHPGRVLPTAPASSGPSGRIPGANRAAAPSSGADVGLLEEAVSHDVYDVEGRPVTASFLAERHQ